MGGLCDSAIARWRRSEQQTGRAVSLKFGHHAVGEEAHRVEDVLMAADSAYFEPAHEPRETELLFQLRDSVDAVFGVAEDSHDRIDHRVVDRAQAVADSLEFRLVRGGEAFGLDYFADGIEVVAQAGLDGRSHLSAIASDED